MGPRQEDRLNDTPGAETLTYWRPVSRLIHDTHKQGSAATPLSIGQPWPCCKIIGK